MNGFSIISSCYIMISAALLHSCAAFSLNPSTPPEEIIERQLAALRDDDIGTVYRFASPANKRQTGDLAGFSAMVRKGPYRYLLGHSRSDILLESKIMDSRQFLVRVASPPRESEEEGGLLLENKKRAKVLEYWWSLSRCKSGEFAGSYMVDAVIPTQL